MKGTLEHGESDKRQSDSASNNSEKRQSVVSIGRQLVNDVAKILVTADSADIITLNRALEQVVTGLCCSGLPSKTGVAADKTSRGIFKGLYKLSGIA